MSAVAQGQTPAPSAPEFFPHEVNNSRDNILANIRANIARNLPQLEQGTPKDTTLIIAAGGPSLRKNLDLLRALGGHIMAVNGAYKFLYEQGIVSDFFVMLDSRRENLVHVEKPVMKTMHLLASQVHPDVYDALEEFHVIQFHPGTDATLEATKDYDEGQLNFLTAPIGMASIHAIYVAAALGYTKIKLFGYDFSEEPGARYSYEQPLNETTEKMEIVLNGQKFTTTLSMGRTAEQFAKVVSPVMKGHGLDIELWSEGLLPAMIKIVEAQNTIETERLKYEAIWGKEAYSVVAPGLSYIAEAVGKLGAQKGDTVADFGCGTGRAVKWLIDEGFNGIGVDITPAGLSEDIPFVQAALWEKLPTVQYGFSTDVMEHIPTEKVRDTLQAIYDACQVGCYLNIDTIPDSMGLMIGQVLHLTVMEYEQWETLLKEYWPHVEGYSFKKQAIFVCRR